MCVGREREEGDGMGIRGMDCVASLILGICPYSAIIGGAWPLGGMKFVAIGVVALVRGN